MKTALRRRWIHELRYGGFKRIQGTMHNGEGFDPLGVLCEIELRNNWEHEGRELPNGMEMWSIVHGIHKGILVPPASFLHLIGLSFLDVAHMMRTNDMHGATFIQTATWIEEHL